jgi:hypothetical protein
MLTPSVQIRVNTSFKWEIKERVILILTVGAPKEPYQMEITPGRLKQNILL